MNPAPPVMRTRSAIYWRLRIRRLEEGGHRAGRACDDDHGPELEHDVDDSAAHRERVLDLRGDRQQLNRGEEGRVAERLHLGAGGVPLEEVDPDGAECVDDERREDYDRQTREQPPVPGLVRGDPAQLLANRAHVSSVANRAEGATLSCACLTPRKRTEQGSSEDVTDSARRDTYGAKRVSSSARPRFAAKPSARSGGR